MIHRHSPVATAVGWVAVLVLAGLSLWVFARGSPMSALTLVPPVLSIEVWLFLRTPRVRHSWRKVAVVLVGSSVFTGVVLSSSLRIHEADPVGLILLGLVLWLPFEAMVFLAVLSLWEGFERWRSPVGH